ncbi:MAG: aminodeoxychorismate synthase, component I, partial [Xanthomonadaceae bacterium]|nr:aminodeoxychorismate synthase, component I [Xanthomonadaceae bacterium]
MNNTENGSAVCRRIAGARDLLPLADAYPGRYPALLESAAPGPSTRWDILFSFPEDRLVLGHDDVVRDASGRARGTRFLDALDAAWRAGRDGQGDAGLPFMGGWLLYLGYELAREVEPSLVLPMAQATHMPVALALHCPAAVLVDRAEGCTWLVAERGRGDLLDAMRRDLEAATANFEVPLPAPREWREDDPRR